MEIFDTSVLAYIWAICISFAPVYRLFGELAYLFPLFLIALGSRKMVLYNRLTEFIIVFALFVGIKAIGIHGTQPISVFFSAYGVVVNYAYLLLLFIFLPTYNEVINVDIRTKCIKIIITFYHIGLISSIITMLIQGRTLYRMIQDGMTMVPQFYILNSVFITIGLTYCFLHYNKNRLLILFLIAVNGAYVILSNYTTQMIFWIFGIVLTIVLCGKMKTTYKALWTLFLIPVAIFLIRFSPEIISYINLKFFSNNAYISVRLKEVETLLRFQDIGGSDLDSRFDLINLSIDSFLKNPLTGVPFSRYNTVDTGIVVGTHCEWPDDLARFGIIGLLIFIPMLHHSLKYAIKLTYSKRNIYTVILLVMILYGFFNPIIRISTMLGVFIACQFVELICSEPQIENQ